jgi:hypothetical protein
MSSWCEKLDWKIGCDYILYFACAIASPVPCHLLVSPFIVCKERRLGGDCVLTCREHGNLGGQEKV